MQGKVKGPRTFSDPAGGLERKESLLGTLVGPNCAKGGILLQPNSLSIPFLSLNMGALLVAAAFQVKENDDMEYIVRSTLWNIPCQATYPFFSSQ